jgi:hypothetical protein
MNLAVVTENPIQHLQRQVPSLPLPLYLLQETDTLYIMEKPAYLMRFTKNGEKSLPIMPEGSMTNIVPKGYSLNEVLIKPEKTPYGPCDLGHKLHMQNPVGDVIIFYQIKNLSLVYIPGIG